MLQADLYALRDYSCEIEILKKHKTTVREQIIRTFEHHLKLLELHDKLNVKSQPVPVIQGWNIEDYLYCTDIYRDHGIIMDYMAIGTLCRRGMTKTIRKIILTIKNELPTWVKIHAFGVKIKVLGNKAVWNSTYGFDTSSWSLDGRWSSLINGRKRIETKQLLHFMSTFSNHHNF